MMVITGNLLKRKKNVFIHSFTHSLTHSLTRYNMQYFWYLSLSVTGGFQINISWK